MAPSVPIEIAIRVLPGASKNEVVGLTDGTWKVRLTAPPIDGRANLALVEFLAERLHVSRSQVVLIKGNTSRNKIVAVYGLSSEEITRTLSIK